MTPAQIRRLVDDHVEGGLDGSLDEDNTRNVLLAEIAIQLSTMNEQLDKILSALNRPRRLGNRNRRHYR